MDPELSVADIDCDITLFQNLLSIYPRSHSAHITGVQSLAMAQFRRYQLSQEKEDLDKCIVHCTKVSFLPSVSRAGLSLHAVHLLFHITSALVVRSRQFRQPHDIKYSIEYLRYLRGLPLDSFDVPRNHVTSLLIQVLAIQVLSEAGDGARDIKEMVMLCRELLTSELSTDVIAAAFLLLNLAVYAEFERGRSVQSLDEVIECLRDATKMCSPGSHRILFALANTLFTRSLETHSSDDYEEATALFERILDPNQPGECPDSIRDRASILATRFAHSRSLTFGNPEYSEVSISRLRNSLSSSSISEELKPDIALHNTVSLRALKKRTPMLQKLPTFHPLKAENSGELFHVPEAVRKSYSMTSMAGKIQRLEELLSITPPGTERHTTCLCSLADWYQSKFYRSNDISDIEESVKFGRLSLNATRYSIDWCRFVPLSSLHNTLLLAFERTSKINYLDKLITVLYDILGLKGVQYLHFRTIFRLVPSLLTRSVSSGGQREDTLEAIRLMSMAIDDQYTRESDRFYLSCQWAAVARSISHPTTLTAYKSAMSLIQKTLSFAPTVSIQHAHLVAMGKDCQTLPLDYASFQIDLGQFEVAIETLEQWRALLWSEMRGLRTPVAHLIEGHSPLAKRFAEINQELEALIISVTPSGRPEMEDGVAQGRDGTDPFGRLVVKRQKLVEERDALISQIQGRPGLEGFLKAPSFATLRSAASRGPVILINHCGWRSDILILFHNSLPCSIPTADDFYDRANKLRDELVEARKHGLDSGEYQDALCSVLKDLYELVGEPVIKRLRELEVPEQSRIWWCPTSVFCSLPLHAMGPNPSSDTSDERYFSDLYIPSYTPSLSALIESRKASPQILENPSLLLVAQPDDSLPGVKGEIKVIRSLKSRVTVADLVSSEATPSSVVEGLRSSHFAHLACHGVLETGKPFEASFKLHGGSRLTLLDIVRSQLPDAEFAFLSCCHAAEITEESVADEALHLTAAMQYCGFRSVVGTMWEMADTDGRDLAKSFYKSLFSSQETGVPYHERSAGALRNATHKLRGKRGITLERRVNFVHYGA